MARCTHPSARLAMLFVANDFVTGDRFEVCRCDACGLTVTMPQPNAQALAAYYPRRYHHALAARRFPAPVELLQQVFYGRRARRLERLSGGRPGRVLDFGCGPGFQLEAFRRRGWQVQGVELSEESAAHARDVLRIPVHVGDPQDWPWPDGHFDAIVAWHSLEHLRDPRQVLETLARLLRRGGAAMIGVPDFASPEARFFRDDWFHLDVPRHLCHFTEPWLRGALAEAGLAVRGRSSFVPEYDLFSLVQSTENRLGLGHNLLYETLRARDGAGGPWTWRSARALGLAVPLGLLALPVTIVAAALGRGSSMTLLALET